MRPSNRTRILEAAARVVDHGGVDAVTFESVCKEAGLTRSGVVYHFASREQLLTAMHEFLASRWEATLQHIIGEPAVAAGQLDRHAAYVLACAQSVTSAELRFLLDAAASEENGAPWFAVLERWAPPVSKVQDSPEDLDNFIARLAADGLWVHESLSRNELTPELKGKVAERIRSMLRRSPSDE